MKSTVSQAHCEHLGAFADGELAEPQREAFAIHLATCPDCQEGLHEHMQLAMTALEASVEVSEAEVLPLRAQRPKRGRSVAIGLAAIAAAAAVVLVMTRRARDRETPASIASHIPTERQYEGRSGHEAFLPYRPYSVMRGAVQPPRIPASVLARFENAGDRHGAAAMHIAMGNLAQARRELADLPLAPEIAAERALIALSEQLPEEALEVLSGDDVLGHPAVEWNRALALRDLRLPLAAAEAFDRVAAAGEAGWSDEAQARARELRASAEAPQKAYASALESGLAFAAGGPPPPDEVLTRAPGIARLYTYEAIRTAASNERLDAIAAVAERLDAYYKEPALERAVDAARSLLASRAALQSGYLTLLAGQTLPREESEQLLAEARTSGDSLMLVGLLLHTRQGRLSEKERAELGQLAAALGDSWFTLLAAQLEAEARLAAGDFAGAQNALTDALARCASASSIDYRCLRIESAAATAHAAFHNVTEARAAIESGWQRARKIGFAPFFVRLLQQMADLSLISDQVAGSHASLARAYLREALLRHDDCRGKIYAHEALAELLISQNRKGAAEHLHEVETLIEAGCEAPMSLSRAYLLAHVGQLGEALLPLRAAGLTPGQSALAEHIEGRAAIRTHPAEGRRRLRASIEAAAALSPDDPFAAKARAYSYSVLALSAAENGSYEDVLTLLAEEIGAPAPKQCAIGIVEEEHLAVVVRGRDGAMLGTYRSTPAVPFTASRELVPPEFIAALEGCDAIDVYARPPHHGAPRILPISMPWRHRMSANVRKTRSTTAKHLVVSAAEEPVALGLPRLRSASRPDAESLEGPRATPRRVLAAMREATLIEFHVHGIATSSTAGEAKLVLSPEADGTFELTASSLKNAELLGAPTVFLAACHGSASAAVLHTRASLVSALLDAGARAVIASPHPIPDAQAGPFFARVRAHLAAGHSPSKALALTRQETATSGSWHNDVTLFQ